MNGTMEQKEFLELRLYGNNGKNGARCIVPIRTITGIVEDKDGTFIETGTDGKGKETGVFVSDSYESVRARLKNLG